ncbi:MAG: adenylyltransferase/cytidyltransferase family protein, partial [Treponema sp.]|nr:adenylyltransferase/cytidyltransferase family protein [Treponema sp.]
MLHANHIKRIEYARSLGEILIVGVNTDELVASYTSTPIIPFDERIALVKALKYPDIVIPQHSLNHADKVKKLNFDVFVVGDDWAGKYDYLKEQGVDVVYFPYGSGISSSSLKQRIYENYEQMKKKADSHFPDDIET